jgi:uncharacterized protein
VSAAVHTVRLADVAAQPWRNGGGTTRELLAWPPAADWVVRVSVARIDRSGPFSAFPGVERWFVVLDGAGVELSWEGHVAQVSPASTPLRFDGAAPPGCRLLGGATEDLNLMLRGCRGALEPAGPGAPWSQPARWRGVFTTTACTLHAGSRHDLAAGTLAWSDTADHAAWQLEGTAAPLRAWWLHART